MKVCAGFLSWNGLEARIIWRWTRWLCAMMGAPHRSTSRCTILWGYVPFGWACWLKCSMSAPTTLVLPALQENTSSPDWLVYLAGGGWCYDAASCQGRFDGHLFPNHPCNSSNQSMPCFMSNKAISGSWVKFRSCMSMQAGMIKVTGFRSVIDELGWMRARF